MRLEFTKMEGLGNDYVFIDATRFPISDPAGLAVRLSDRHKGIGSDGLVLIERSDIADFRMRIFNADGSEAQMCGNAARCIALYVREKGLRSGNVFTLETASGIKKLELDGDSISVGMGKWRILGSNLRTESSGKTFCGTAVSVGNPHYVVFVDESELDSIAAYGAELERHPAFPERTNVEFACPVGKDIIRMRVWERGSGLTRACGTGACAVAAAAYEAGLVSGECEIRMDGGPLKIKCRPSGELVMTGPASITFEGKITVNN